MTTTQQDMEGRRNSRPAPVANQSNEEWLNDYEGHAATPRYSPPVKPLHTPQYSFLGYLTRKDKLGKGRLVLELVSSDTGEIVNVYFNVNITYQRGKNKGHYFRTGDRGRFWVLPRSKFAKFWIAAFGKPPRFSTLYRQMGQLKNLSFTGVLDSKPTYKQLLDIKTVRT